MNENKGWISLYRKFIGWEWYTDVNTFKLFIHCLLRANRLPDNWRGRIIERGQFITSLEKLSLETGLTIRQIRTSLKRLKSTHEVTCVSSTQNTIITVNNYIKYQQNDIRNDKQSVTQTTTNNNKDKERDINISLSITKNEREILKSYAKNVAKAKNINAYVKTLIRNGDYEEILAESQRKKQMGVIPPPLTEAIIQVKDKQSACLFIGKYGDFTNENNPKEVKEVMDRYGFNSYDDAVRYSYKVKKGEKK